MITSTLDTALTYDSSEGAADFIINLSGKKIPLEVGYGEKGITQVRQTIKQIPSAPYGILLSQSPLQLFEEEKIVSVPLEYFLLI